MTTREVSVGSAVGLHARPAGLVVEAVAKTGMAVRIGKPGAASMDARSILSLLSLDARHGDVVVLSAEGEGADEALDAVALVVASDHDVDKPAADKLDDAIG